MTFAIAIIVALVVVMHEMYESIGILKRRIKHLENHADSVKSYHDKIKLENWYAKKTIKKLKEDCEKLKKEYQP